MYKQLCILYIYIHIFIYNNIIGMYSLYSACLLRQLCTQSGYFVAYLNYKHIYLTSSIYVSYYVSCANTLFNVKLCYRFTNQQNVYLHHDILQVLSMFSKSQIQSNWYSLLSLSTKGNIYIFNPLLKRKALLFIFTFPLAIIPYPFFFFVTHK